MYFKIKHRYEPDVYFLYKENFFYDFQGFNSRNEPVNPVSTFHKYYNLYEELKENIIKNIDYIKNKINNRKKKIYHDKLVIEIYNQ